MTNEDDAASWDNLVQQLLGPVLSGEDPERRRRLALALAAAALRATGEGSEAAPKSN